MLKKKFYLKDVEFDDGKEIKTMVGFTDDSYVIVDIPSMREKLALNNEMRSISKEDVDSFSVEKVLSMIVDVKAETTEGDLITDVDSLTVFPVDALIGMLGNILRSGYIPKKSKSV